MELVWKEITGKNQQPRTKVLLSNKHGFDQQIPIEILLCARHSFRCWDTEVNKMGNS